MDLIEIPDFQRKLIPEIPNGLSKKPIDAI